MLVSGIKYSESFDIKSEVFSLNSDDFSKLGRQDVLQLAEAKSIHTAEFIVLDMLDQSGLALQISYGKHDKTHKGILCKRDGTPRLFQTPQAIVSNARKLGIKRFTVDTTDWNHDFYNVYDAQVRYAQKKRKEALK